MKNNVVFREVQYFRQKWVWISVGVILFVYGYSLVSELVNTNNVGENQAFFDILYISIIPAVLITILMFTRLVVEIRTYGIYYQLFPIHIAGCMVLWTDIEKYYVRTYNPMNEYEQPGFRFNFMGKNKAYHVMGNEGLQIELKNGSNILLGTQRANEINQFIV